MMRRHWMWGLAIGALAFGPSARAEDLAAPMDRSGDGEPAPEPTADVLMLLPDLIVPPAVGPATATQAAWGERDGGANQTRLGVGVAVRLGQRLVLAGTAVSVNNNSSVQPGLEVRLQVARQETRGVDASLSLGWRRDRFPAEGGLLQLGAAVSRHVGMTTVVAGAAYAQDGEADDREGELQLALVRPLGSHVQLGVEGRYRHALDSTDPLRGARGTPSMMYAAGPLGAVTLGSWALFAQAGASGQRTDRNMNGAFGLVGLGAAF